MKKQNGITLVALVITIIILLILAGISIGTLTNQGLFTQAQKANEATQQAVKNEQNTLNSYENTINTYMPKTTAE